MGRDRTTASEKRQNPNLPSDTGYRGILDILQEAGMPETNPHVDRPAFIISRYFAPGRQEQSITFRELHRDIAAMAAVYQEMGLGAGSKIALAETNSREFFGSYFGGLAIGATMISINLLALQDESSKARNLAHMLGTPRLHEADRAGADLFVVGADPTLQKMQGFGKILALKKRPWLRDFLAPRIDRFANEDAPRGLDVLVFRALARNAKTRKEKRDLQILFQSLPAQMHLMTPNEREKRMSQVHPLYKINHPHPPDDMAEVLYTSGTSGNPKGVALSHGNLAFTVHSLTEGTEDVIRDGDVLLMGLPFFHIFGKAVMLAALSRQMAVARQGGSVGVVVLPSLSKAIQNLDGVLKTIQDYRITLLPAVPVFLEKLVHYLHLHPHKREMIQSLRVIISGGAALKQETFDALSAWVPGLRIIEGYGSSEAGINLLNKAGVPGCVGFPLPGVQARHMPPDEAKGELWVRSPGVSKTYVLGTTESADRAIADADGWFHTGDLVEWDPDHGYRIRGRESFFIKIDNEKRSPGELEEAVRLAVPAALDVWAVAHEPGIHEKAVAVVVVDDAAVTEESIKKTMQQLAKDNLITRWKIPRHLVVIHQPVIPARFDQPFKREAAYKVVRQFLEELLTSRSVIFHHSTDKARSSWTEIADPTEFLRIVDKYNTP